MLEYNSNILKSDERIIYTDNLQAIKDITRSLLEPNQLIITSYNYDFYKNYNYHSGISYELYYADNDSHLHQLTYFVNEGNGMYIDDDYNLTINIDNKTIKTNENHELYIDSDELTCAYNETIKGVLCGDSRPFYDHHLNESGFIVSDNGILKLSNGLLMSLYEIQNYYNQFDKLALEINKIAVKLNFEVDVFEVGDILYIDKNSKYTKVAEGNMPYMICVIASNTLSDGAARFLPLNFNTSQSIFARNNNNLYYKKLFSHVPVYGDDLNMLSRDSNIELGDYGYIASDNEQWSDNFKNPFNFKEHYYANLKTMKTDIIWYMDPDTFHKSDKYSLDAKSIVTEVINFNQLDINDTNNDLCPIVEIEFSDGFKAYYMLIFTYSKENQRYELTETSKPIENGLLLINKINDTIASLTEDNNLSSNPKIKLYKNENLINSKEFITQFNIIQNDTTIRKVKFENDNYDNIDYKILVQDLKNKTITEDSEIIVKKTGEEINEDDLYINNSNSNSTSQKNTLAAVHNNANKNKSYNEEVIKHITKTTTVYTYKLIIDPGICDRAYAYFVVQLGDNNQNVSEEIYLKYDSSTGLEYVFTQYQSTSSTGYIKIKAYASSEFYDKEPIDLGIIAVNGYQDSFKVIYLSKDKFSFKFNLSTIIPIKAKIYKNYTILSLKDNADILESNDYDDFADSYEYSLDLNYYTISSNMDIELSKNTDSVKETITYSEISNNKETGEDNNIEVYDESISEDEISTSEESNDIQEVEEEVQTETGNTITVKKKVYPLWWLRQHRYRIIPGAIRIMLKDIPEHKYDFMNNVYYAQINIRNGLGLPTYARFKFIKRRNYLELAEDIPVYDIMNINQISIKSIQDSKGNNLDIKLRQTGDLINRTSEWSDLRLNN